PTVEPPTGGAPAAWCDDAPADGDGCAWLGAVEPGVVGWVGAGVAGGVGVGVGGPPEPESPVVVVPGTPGRTGWRVAWCWGPGSAPPSGSVMSQPVTIRFGSLMWLALARSVELANVPPKRSAIEPR